MAEPIHDLLSRNPEWVAAARNSLINVSYSSPEAADAIAVAQREAFDFARRGRYDQAERALTKVTESISDKTVKGWLVEQIGHMCILRTAHAVKLYSLPPTILMLV
jgi:hypothetical protein